MPCCAYIEFLVVILEKEQCAYSEQTLVGCPERAHQEPVSAQTHGKSHRASATVMREEVRFLLSTSSASLSAPLPDG